MVLGALRAVLTDDLPSRVSFTSIAFKPAPSTAQSFRLEDAREETATGFDDDDVLELYYILCVQLVV